jgi:hypothetical protein
MAFHVYPDPQTDPLNVGAGATSQPAAVEELSGRELVDKSGPALRAGMSESARFTPALADYRQVVDQCEARTP